MLGHLLNKQMDIETPTLGQDAVGGVTKAWAKKASQVRCRIRQLAESEREGLGREMVASTHRVYCDADVNALTKDEVVIDAVRYQVLGVDDPHHMGDHKELNVILRA